MTNDYKSFYSNYLKNYHIVKANYLNTLIENHADLNKELKAVDEFWDVSHNSKFILLAEMRQNYFHAIETVFELLFALLPTKDKIPDNRLLLKSLVKSDWRKNQRERAIAAGKKKLNFLYDSSVEINNFKVQVGHYLFYNGTYSNAKFDLEYYGKVENSLKAIEKGLIKLAIDFTKNDEYNAYKHGIRIFPNFDKMSILDAKSMAPVATFDLSESMSYYLYDNKNKKASVKTKVLDFQRDFRMTEFCSRLIYNIIALREVVNSDVKKDKGQIAIYLFKDSDISDAAKQNVTIQDLTFVQSEVGSS